MQLYFEKWMGKAILLISLIIAMLEFFATSCFATIPTDSDFTTVPFTSPTTHYDSPSTTAPRTTTSATSTTTATTATTTAAITASATAATTATTTAATAAGGMSSNLRMSNAT
jgi:hypothetical protein